MTPDEEWKRNHPAAAGWRPKPELQDAVGKFLVVSQHGEPPHDRKVYWSELDERWWKAVRPALLDQREIWWGHSTWRVAEDGELVFSGANYDSSD